MRTIEQRRTVEDYFYEELSSSKELVNITCDYEWCALLCKMQEVLVIVILAFGRKMQELLIIVILAFRQLTEDKLEWGLLKNTEEYRVLKNTEKE